MFYQEKLNYLGKCFNSKTLNIGASYLEKVPSKGFKKSRAKQIESLTLHIIKCTKRSLSERDLRKFCKKILTHKLTRRLGLMDTLSSVIAFRFSFVTRI